MHTNKLYLKFQIQPFAAQPFTCYKEDMNQINVFLSSQDPNVDPQEFDVEIAGDDGTKTTHRVQVAKETHQRLTGGLKSPEELVRTSFEFLL